VVAAEAIMAAAALRMALAEVVLPIPEELQQAQPQQDNKPETDES
jgi:hypothetical protein